MTPSTEFCWEWCNAPEIHRNRVLETPNTLRIFIQPKQSVVKEKLLRYPAKKGRGGRVGLFRQKMLTLRSNPDSFFTQVVVPMSPKYFVCCFRLYCVTSMDSCPKLFVYIVSYILLVLLGCLFLLLFLQQNVCCYTCAFFPLENAHHRICCISCCIIDYCTVQWTLLAACQCRGIVPQIVKINCCYSCY